MTVLLAKDVDHPLAQRRVLAVFPSGVVARDVNAAAELRHQAAQTRDEHLLLRGHAAAHAKRRLHALLARGQDAEVQRRLHQSRNVLTHGLNPVRQAAEHTHGALRGRRVHRQYLRLCRLCAHEHIRVGCRVFVPERRVHARDRGLRRVGVGDGDDGAALARDGVVLQSAVHADDAQRRARTDGVQHTPEKLVCVSAPLVDLRARVAAEQAADRDGERRARKRRARDRQRAHGDIAARAADGEDALILGVDVEHRAPLEHGGVERVRAEHTGLLIDREHHLERGMRDVVRVQNGKRHRNGDAVVPTEGCTARADRVAVHEEVEPFAGHVLCAVRRGLADHVHVPLQNDRRGGLIARRAGAEDDDVVVRILNVAQTARGGKAHEMIADRFRVSRAVRDGAQLLKVRKDGLRLKLFQNRHGVSPFF